MFCLSSLFMLWSSLSWAYLNTNYETRWSSGVSIGVSIGIMLVGVVLSWFDRR